MSTDLAMPALPRARATRFGRRANWQAFGAAFSLEMLALGALLTWWALQPAKPELRRLPLEIEAPSPTSQPSMAAPQPPVPVPPPPRAAPPRTPSPVARPRTPPPVAPARPAPTQAAPAPPEPAMASASPTETAAPAAEAAPVAAPAPVSAAPPAPSSEYIAQVRAAVQAAFVYPPAAAALGIPRRTRVAFTLHGVTPAGARVLVGSGMAMMDRAALQSVQAASYPAPPPEMKGVDASFEVWVEFKP